MGREGGNYQVSDAGNKKKLAQTKPAKPVSGKSTRLEEQAAAENKAAETKPATSKTKTGQ